MQFSCDCYDWCWQVVHNYGHGAEGIGLSWGTAVDAVRIVGEILTSKTYLTSKI